MFFRQSEPVTPSGDYQGLLNGEVSTYGDEGGLPQEDSRRGDDSRRKRYNGGEKGGSKEDRISPHPILVNHQKYCTQIVNIPEELGESLEIYQHQNYFFCQVFWKRENSGILSGWWGNNNKYTKDPCYLFLDYPVKKITICRNEGELEAIILRQTIANPLYQEEINMRTSCSPISSIEKTFWSTLLTNKSGKRVGLIYSYSQTKIHIIKKTIEDFSKIIR